MQLTLCFFTLIIKGIPKQKIKCVLKIGPWLSELTCERTKFQLLFLQKLSSIYWFCWEPPVHFFPSHLQFFCVAWIFLRPFWQFFCVACDGTQKNCRCNAKKLMQRKKIVNWDQGCRNRNNVLLLGPKYMTITLAFHNGINVSTTFPWQLSMYRDYRWPHVKIVQARGCT